MATALVALATTTLASTSSSVTFSGIPGGYRDLVLVSDYTGSGNLNEIYLRFNSDSGANYSNVVMGGNGSTTYTNTFGTLGLMFGYYIVSPNRAMGKMSIMDYSATDKHKTALNRTDIQGSDTAAYAGRWASSAAITSITIVPTASSFAAGSTFSLYGIVS